MRLTDSFKSGKHKGNTLADVILDDLKHVKYLVEEMGLQLDNEAYGEYEENLRYEI